MIFVPSKLQHKSCQTGCMERFPEHFTVLCWNVHKKNLGDTGFSSFVHSLMQRYPLSLVLLQEAQIEEDSCAFSAFSYDAAANIEINRRFYGVLTASMKESSLAEVHLTESSEGFVGPHKSLLLTTYALPGGEALLLLNVHAINFREQRIYEEELHVLMKKAAAHKGPMIVAGDFNAWSRKRTDALHMLRETLSLQTAAFEAGKVKSFMGYPLDFILYRGLRCIETEIITDHGISDHHPLLATFRLLP